MAEEDNSDTSSYYSQDSESEEEEEEENDGVHLENIRRVITTPHPIPINHAIDYFQIFDYFPNILAISIVCYGMYYIRKYTN